MELNEKIIALESGLKYRSQKLIEYQLNQPFYFIMKLQEEVGEVAGAYSKLLRGFNMRELHKMNKKSSEPKNLSEMPRLELERFASEMQIEWVKKKELNIKEELADTLMMLIQVAQKFGVDYSTLIDISIRKFNQVNKELGEEFTQFNINTNG